MKQQRIIAFAYVDAHKQFSPLYRTLCEDLCNNIHQVMPGVEVMHVTDRETPFVEASDIRMRVDRDVPLMAWRTRAHEAAHLMGEEIVFTEPDVRFKKNVLEVFDRERGFDVAVTGRKVNSDWKLSAGWRPGEPANAHQPPKEFPGSEHDEKLVKLSDIAPYTMGCTFSRSGKFWADCTARILTYPEREQLWIGDMIALAEVIATGTYKVMVVGDEYNHVPCSREDDCDVAVLHYKGMRKEWALPGMREAAA